MFGHVCRGQAVAITISSHVIALQTLAPGKTTPKYIHFYRFYSSPVKILESLLFSVVMLKHDSTLLGNSC